MFSVAHSCHLSEMRVDTVVPILQMEKLKHSEVESLAGVTQYLHCYQPGGSGALALLGWCFDYTKEFHH